MDPVTHALSGLIGANVIKKRRWAERADYSYLFLIGTLFPDVDYISRFIGTATFLRYHRGVTHSLVFAVIFSLLISLLFRKFRENWRFWIGAISMFSGLVVHIYLDLITSFGTEVFFPFSTKRFYLDWMFVVDPFFTTFLLIGWVIARVSRRFDKFVALVVIVYPVFCGFIKQEVTKSIVYSEKSEAFIVLPEFLTPCFWKVIYEEDDYLCIKRVSVFSSSSGTGSLRYRKLDLNGVKEALEKFKELKTFVKFSRFPVVFQEDKNGGMYILADARFITTWQIHKRHPQVPFVLAIFKNKKGEFIKAGFL